MRNLSLLALLLFAASCAPTGSSSARPEQSVGIQGGVLAVSTARQANALTDEFMVGAEEMFVLVPRIYDYLGLEVNSADRDNLVVGIEGVRVRRIGGNRLSTYLSCGRGVAGPNADTFEVTMTALTQVVPQTEGSQIRVQVLGSARNRTHGGSAVTCQSTGELEETILDLLHQVVG